MAHDELLFRPTTLNVPNFRIHFNNCEPPDTISPINGKFLSMAKRSLTYDLGESFPMEVFPVKILG